MSFNDGLTFSTVTYSRFEESNEIKYNSFSYSIEIDVFGERERERERESFIQQALLLVAYETISRFVSYKFKTICIYLVILNGGLTFKLSKQQSHLNLMHLKPIYFLAHNNQYKLPKAIIEI